MKAIKFHTAKGWKSLLEVLEVRRNVEGFKSDKFNDLLKELAFAYVRNVRMVGGGPSDWRAVGLEESLDLCLRCGGNGCFGALLERILRETPTTEYLDKIHPTLINNVFLTLIKKHDVSMTDDPFATAIRTVMDKWIKYKLEPCADNDTHSTLMTVLSRWNCTCAPCLEVRKMLKGEVDKTKVELIRIGPAKCNHVEQMIDQYARGLAVPNRIGKKSLSVSVSGRPYE